MDQSMSVYADRAMHDLDTLTKDMLSVSRKLNRARRAVRSYLWRIPVSWSLFGVNLAFVPYDIFFSPAWWMAFINGAIAAGCFLDVKFLIPTSRRRDEKRYQNWREPLENASFKVQQASSLHDEAVWLDQFTRAMQAVDPRWKPPVGSWQPHERWSDGRFRTPTAEMILSARWGVQSVGNRARQTWDKRRNTRGTDGPSEVYEVVSDRLKSVYPEGGARHRREVVDAVLDEDGDGEVDLTDWTGPDDPRTKTWEAELARAKAESAAATAQFYAEHPEIKEAVLNGTFRLSGGKKSQQTYLGNRY